MDNRQIEQQSTAIDISLHLLTIVLLYAIIASVIGLLFSLISIYFPDTLQSGRSLTFSAWITWNLTLLIVEFPLYLLIMWYLNKSYLASPFKREIKVRRWLIAFTLFLAGLVIIGDFISLIYNFLQGELTLRFILKFLIVLVIASIVLGYYYLDLRRPDSPMLKFLAYLSIIIVVVSVVAGFLIVDSPLTQRLLKFDNQRVSDLRTIQNEVTRFYQSKGQLPQSIGALKDDIRGFNPPQDPQTKKDYGYEITETLSFKLCADFAKPSPEEQAGLTTSSLENWKHDSGYYCFERTIDPQRYRTSGSTTQASLPASLQTKMQKIQQQLPSWLPQNPSRQNEVVLLMQKLDQYVKAGNYQEAEKTADEILKLVGAE